MNVARQGGHIAGQARKEIEQATNKKVVSPTNYLTARQRVNNAKAQPPELNDILKKLLNAPSASPEIQAAVEKAKDAQ
jgi:hypothetical protein